MLISWTATIDHTPVSVAVLALLKLGCEASSHGAVADCRILVLPGSLNPPCLIFHLTAGSPVQVRLRLLATIVLTAICESIACRRRCYNAAVDQYWRWRSLQGA